MAIDSTNVTVTLKENEKDINFNDLLSGTLFIYKDIYYNKEELGMKIYADIFNYNVNYVDTQVNANYVLNVKEGTFCNYDAFKTKNKIIKVIENIEIIEK